MTAVSAFPESAGRGQVLRHPVVRRLGLGVSVVVVLQLVFRSIKGFPENWYLRIAEPVNSLQSWVRDNRLTHPLFRWFFQPITKTVGWGLDSLTSLLLWVPWFALAAVVFLLMARSRRYPRAVVVTALFCYPGLVGLWKESMQTLALMLVAVIISVAIGVPLGVWSALHPRVERSLRPVLDAMQTVPATVYLIPAVLLFGIGQVPAAIATFIYALPPVVRLTTLGIQQVPAATVEAGRVFGSNKRQLLTKVQLPLAVPSIIAGVNQTIMMALGIVVVASLVGAGGLGQEVVKTLQLRSPGRGFVAGFAIVAIALVMDRLSRSFLEGRRAGSAAIERSPTQFRESGRAANTAVGQLPRTVRLVALIGAIAGAVVVGRAAGWVGFPRAWSSSIADPVDKAVLWVRDHTSGVTRPFNDFIVRDIIVRGRAFLTGTVVWPALLAFAVWLAWWAKGWKLALFTGCGLFVIGLAGTWAISIDTLTQTLVAVALSVLIAVPVGIWVGRRPRLERVLSPMLDALQTIPSLIYTIPFVMIFSVGPVPGIIASVLYAIPPGIRLTALGIQQVAGEPVEAATTFGATNRQVLWGVRVPLAMPNIILAVNQVIMMVLAMVIIAGLAGAGALGFKAVEALTRTNTGLGVEVGLSIVIMAMILDRLTQAVAERLRPPMAS